MSYQLRFGGQVKRQLESLPGDIRSVARKQLKALADEPRPSGAKELDDHPGYYRIWLPRDTRLVYQVLDEDQVVYLLYLGPKRPDLYEQLGLGRKKP